MSDQYVGPCVFCKKPVTRFSGGAPISRWHNGTEDVCAHYSCYSAARGFDNCPECGSDTGIKLPATGDIYCEDCGWPDVEGVSTATLVEYLERGDFDA